MVAAFILLDLCGALKKKKKKKKIIRTKPKNKQQRQW